MAEGRLRTIGSSFFLKKKFGTGYKLICAKETNCKVDAILNALKEFSPDAHIESDNQVEVVFVINEDHLPIFHEILKRLEDNSKLFGISTFGLNLTSLEEVFLKLGTETHELLEDDHHDSSNYGTTTVAFEDTLSNRVTGMSLMAYQVEAMVLKKFHYTRRNYNSILYMVILTLVLVIFFMYSSKLSFFDISPMKISMEPYSSTTTLIEADNSMTDLAKEYKSLLTGKDDSMMIYGDMQTFAFNKSKDSIATFNRKFLIGASMGTNLITAWFNGQPFHTMPLTLNMINRAVLRKFSGNDHDIQLINHPYEHSIISDDELNFAGDMLGFVMTLVLLYILMLYWPSIFIAFYIKERDSRAKLLQFISGANRFVYWLTSFVIDYTIFLVAICGVVFGIGIYQRAHFSTAEELGAFVLILAVNAFSTLPLVYAVSYMFQKPASGESFVTFGGMLREFQIFE